MVPTNVLVKEVPKEVPTEETASDNLVPIVLGGSSEVKFDALAKVEVDEFAPRPRTDDARSESLLPIVFGGSSAFDWLAVS